jgi:DivIVA domain-containing protein
VELNRQSIERRDFPIGRRGYDPAAVDEHLRALAAEVEELQRAAARAHGAGESLASTAGAHVQSILAAAETAALEIEREARDASEQLLAEADDAARQTREEAIRIAQSHVAAVLQATAALQERVESMDAETGALIDGLRVGSGRLGDDLAALEAKMAILYDAAAGRSSAAVTSPEPVQEPLGQATYQATSQDTVEGPDDSDYAEEAGESPLPPVWSTQAEEAEEEVDLEEELDGVRLVALNMALNGDSREQTDRYLAENFQIDDRARLLDEVYAAIEG